MSLEETGQDAPVVDNAATPPATVTAPAETLVSDTQTETQDEKVPAVEKTFTQTELNEILEKRIARAEAKAERRVIQALERIAPQQPQQQYQPPVNDKPAREHFANDEAYIESLTDWKIDQRESAGKQQKVQEQSRAIESKTENMYAEAAKIPGFDRDDFNDLPLTPAIVQTIVDSDVAPKLMAYMAANPGDIARIATLSPARQAAELGKLEAKVASQKAPRVSSAPEPISTIGSQGGTVKSLASATMDEYIAMRTKQGARWAR